MNLLRPTLQVSLTSKKNADAITDAPHIDTETINQLVKEHVKNVSVAVVAVYAAVTAMKTVSEIAINAAPKR